MEKEILNVITYFGIGMMIVLPIGIYGFIMIDKLIKQMYTSHNEEWINSGKPSGMFYYPQGTKNLQSMMSMQLSIFAWIFKTPTWIKNDKIAVSYLKNLRFSLLLANLLMLGLFAFVIFSILG